MGALMQQTAAAPRKPRRLCFGGSRLLVAVFEILALLSVTFILVRVLRTPAFLSGRSRRLQGSLPRVPWAHEALLQESVSSNTLPLWPDSGSEGSATASSRQVKLFGSISVGEEEEDKSIWDRGFLEQDLADMFGLDRGAAAAKAEEEAKAEVVLPELPPFVAEAISRTDGPPVIPFPEDDPRLRSQKGQDKWLLSTFFKGGNQQPGRGLFVEFGARNGQEESNSFFFEKVLGWRGILAEASPADQRNIASVRNHSTVVNGAMCKDESKRQYGELEYGLSGLLEKYDRKRMIEREVSMKKMEVQCYRLDKVLDFLGVRAIDYMSVDTEGSELEALSAFPFDRIPCQIIGIEVLIGPGRKGRTNKTVDFMEERGYRLFHPYKVATDTLDMFFVPKDLKDASVFSGPRIDVEKFLEARERCRGLNRMCL